MRLRTGKTELKPGIRDDRHLARFFGQTGRSWRDLDLHGPMFQFALREHPGTDNTVFSAQPLSRNHHINRCQPVDHERMVPCCAFLLRRSKVRRDPDTHLLRVLTAPMSKGEDMRRLAVLRHWQGTKTKNIVIINKSFEPALHVAVVIQKCGMEKPACLCGC